MNSLLRCGLAALLLATPLRPVGAAVVADPPVPDAVAETGATSPLLSLAYAPDGSSIWSLGQSGELLERDGKSGAIRFRGQISGEASRLMVLSDGSILAASVSGGATRYAKPVAGQPLLPRTFFNLKEVGLQALTNPPTFFELELGDLAISPDEKWVAMETIETAYLAAPANGRPTFGRQAGAKTARIRVWNLEDGTMARELAPLAADAGTPRLAWSDGQVLVAALPDASVQRFNAQSGELQSEWKPPATDAAPAAAPMDEAEIERRLERLPEAARERARARLTRPRAPRTRPARAGAAGSGVQAVSRDGNLVLVAASSGMQVWNTRDGSQRVLEGSERVRVVEETQFSPDGTLVALRYGSSFWLWKTDGTSLGTARIPFEGFSALTFAPNASALALGDEAGVAREWKTGAPLGNTAQTTFPGYFQAWTQLSALPDGVLGATARGAASVKATEPLLWFENTPLEAPAELSPLVKTQTRQQVIALQAAPDGKFWAESVGWSSYQSTMSSIGIPRGELRGRDAQSGAILWRVPDPDNFKTVDLLRFLPDGTLLTGKPGPGRSLTPDADALSGLQARNGQTGERKPFSIAWGDKVGLREPAGIAILEPDAAGKRLVLSSGGGGNGLQIVDLAGKSVVGFFGANIDLERGPWATSTDGKWLAGNYRNGIGVWDISGARTSTSIAPDVIVKSQDGARVTALKFGAGGGLAAGFSDGRVRVFKLEVGAMSVPAWETAGGRAITSLAFSGDGNTLWSGDERGELRNRNAATGALRFALRLLAPPTATDAPAWVKWNRAGKVERSKP